MSGERTAYVLEKAWVNGAVRDDVRVEIVDGRFASVEVGRRNSRLDEKVSSAKHEFHRPAGETPLAGLTLPGLANTHSHAFHRALRGRTQRGTGSFWTWREQMYAVAERLDPDTYYTLARATFREMVAAGITTVGEFHYLHHQPDGTPYDDPNAMGHAMIAAARDVGLRIALLDTCYLASGFGSPVEGVQRRYSDGDLDTWRTRVEDLRSGSDDPGVVIGEAIHSVRAVPLENWIPTPGIVHAHVSEQPAENDACLAATGRTPSQLLADAGVLTENFTAVHATHLTETDIVLLGGARSHVGFCPTTERDLADGIGPSTRLRAAGARLTLGSDSHAVIDLFEEMRAVELNERLASGTRGNWTAADLIEAATTTGHSSLGFPDAGQIAVGQRADLVTLDLHSPRTAGTGGDDHTAVFAASAADVTHVLIDGHAVHRQPDTAEIGRDLHTAIARIHP